jgi:antitoxin MazE
VRAVVRKWGNSGAVRIPSALLRAANLQLDQPVELHEESGRILIEPSSRKEYRLAELLQGITRANRHKEAEFGRRVGAEAW